MFIKTSSQLITNLDSMSSCELNSPQIYRISSYNYLILFMTTLKKEKPPRGGFHQS